MDTFDLFGHELRKLIGQWHRDGRNDPHDLALALAVEAVEMAKRVKATPAFHGALEAGERRRMGWSKPLLLVDNSGNRPSQLVQGQKGHNDEPHIDSPLRKEAVGG